jgi:multisubunit Na+/H+ antiporter MnhC subunit
VDVNAGNILHFCLPLALCLVGFHGVFFYANLWRKAAGWGLFQLGLMVFLSELAPPGNPLPHVLILLVLACTLGVGILLAVFCLKLGKQFKTAGGGETKRGSK